MVDLLGERDAYLRMVEGAFPEVRIVARGNELDIAGPENIATMGRTVFDELLILIQEGEALDADSRQGLAHVVELERLDDGNDHFHSAVSPCRFLASRHARTTAQTTAGVLILGFLDRRGEAPIEIVQ